MSDIDTPPPAGEVLWAANLTVNGDLHEYANLQQRSPDRITVVQDPLGNNRKVMKITVDDTDTAPYTPTENPRAQALTPSLFTEGKDFWIGSSLMVPDVDELPYTSGDSTPWIALGSVYGPPYAGKGPNGLGLESAAEATKVYWMMNSTSDMELAWEMTITRKTWVDFVQHIMMSQDKTVGYREIWANTGSGWQRCLLSGRERRYYATLDSSNNGGANHHVLALYYEKGQMPSGTLYYADHAVGTSFSAVAPKSYDSPLPSL